MRKKLTDPQKSAAAARLDAAKARMAEIGTDFPARLRQVLDEVLTKEIPVSKPRMVRLYKAALRPVFQNLEITHFREIYARFESAQLALDNALAVDLPETTSVAGAQGRIEQMNRLLQSTFEQVTGKFLDQIMHGVPPLRNAVAKQADVVDTRGSRLKPKPLLNTDWRTQPINQGQLLNFKPLMITYLKQHVKLANENLVAVAAAFYHDRMQAIVTQDPPPNYAQLFQQMSCVGDDLDDKLAREKRHGSQETGAVIAQCSQFMVTIVFPDLMKKLQWAQGVAAGNAKPGRLH